MIGGVTGADLQATLLGLGMRAIPAENIALEAFATQKNLWRAGQLDCPTGCSSDAPLNDCKCACTKLQTWLDEDRAAGILLSVSPIFADDLYLTNRPINAFHSELTLLHADFWRWGVEHA